MLQMSADVKDCTSVALSRTVSLFRLRHGIQHISYRLGAVGCVEIDADQEPQKTSDIEVAGACGSVREYYPKCQIM
jgi:hypothetical protein